MISLGFPSTVMERPMTEDAPPNLREKALAVADRVYALVQGHIVLEARTGEANLPQRLEQAYLG
jgi:hypothetical protein